MPTRGRSRHGLASFLALNIVIVIMIFDVACSGIAKVNAEDILELEEHLNRLNKPAVKTIQSDADIIDCIDINKQLAFDHLLLQNHTIQMRPSSVPKGEENRRNSSTAFEQTWQKHGSCPDGTVAIRRVQMSDLRRAASLESFGRREEQHGVTQDQAGATVEDGGPYFGAKADINIWGITVEPNEWSHSAIEISDKKRCYIEVGLLVDPSLFGDAKTRLYTYWTDDGYKQSGCYNLLCTGFIQVSKKYAIGAEITTLSVYEGQQYILYTSVWKDKQSGNWWMKIKDEDVGYWPWRVFGFDGGFTEAWKVKWIGSVLNTWRNGYHTTTHMGSGHFPDEGFGMAAYFGNVGIVKDDYYFHKPQNTDWYATTWSCYNSQWANDEGILVYYGGPGGANCEQYSEDRLD